MEKEDREITENEGRALISFDKQITRLRSLLEEWGPRLKSFSARLETPEKRQAFMSRIGLAARGRGRPIIVPSDETALELGKPGTSAVNIVMWTKQPTQVHADLIHLLGPDMPEAQGKSLSFAQVIMLALAEDASPDPFMLESAQYLSNRLPGYMVRMVPGRLWARVSREALRDGLDFAGLGKALIAAYREDFDFVQAVEVLFVTSGPEEVESLRPLAAEARIITGKNKKLVLVGDGEYECTDLNCDDCEEKEVCDEIRDILVIRRKRKESAPKAAG